MKDFGSLIVLGFIVSIVVSACCANTPTLDVEATVEAAITATQTAQPTTTSEPKPMAISIQHTPTLTSLAQDSDTLLLSTTTPTSSDTSLEISAIVPASDGGELTLPNKTVLRIPPNSLQEDTQVAIRRVAVDNVPSAQQELAFVGDAYHIDLDTNNLEEPATLEIPFDSTLLPDDSNSEQVFLSYYNESKKEWIYAGGEVDVNRGVIILQITHASWWAPTTWNWAAWIAILNKVLQASVVDWFEAGQLLMDDCPQIETYVQVDSHQARNVVQGCVERDDIARPELRVINPKSFFFEVRPVAGGNGYPSPVLLSPGDDLKFEASTLDPSPLTIVAQMTQKSGQYWIVHMVIKMLPGANQFGIQGHHIACITERLDDVSYFISATEALLVDQNGEAAAESIIKFMSNSDAVRRFITAADDCNFGPARTWSIKGFELMGGGLSNLISVVDYAANWFAGNNNAHISFIWTPPPTPVVLPARNRKIIFNSVFGGERTYYIIDVDGSGLAPFTEIHGGYGDWSPDANRVVFSHESDIYVMNSNGSGLTNLTGHAANDKDPIWSPDGRQILFISNRDEPNPENCLRKLSIQCNDEIYVMNTDGSGLTNLTNDPGLDEDHAWLPNGQVIFSRSGSIYVVNGDGSNVQKIAEGTSPLLSPDGSRFVYFRRDPCCMWLMDTNDSSSTFILDKLGAYNRSGIVWSPDGQRIVFAADLREYESVRQIYVVNADGSGFSPLTSPPGLNDQPAWSPGGETIAYMSTRDGNEEIYVMNVDGSNQTRLTDRPDFIDIFPRWSR